MFYKKTSNGKYRYYEKYYDESEGKWKQATITLNSKTRQAQGEARRKLEAKIEKKLLIGLGIISVSELTIKEVYDEYQKKRKQELKDSTYSEQTRVLEIAFKAIWDKKITSIPSTYFQRYFMLQDNSTSYKKSQRDTLNQYFKYALKVGYITENPIAKVELPRNRKTLEELEKKKAKFFSQSEMGLFIKALNTKQREIRKNLLIEFMYLTGIRIGEAIGLLWENVDLDNKFIDIKYTIDYHSVSHKCFKLSSPKTANSYRKISINNRCVEILKTLRKINKRIKVKDPRFVFIEKNGYLVCPELLNIYLKKCGKIANIKDKDFTCFSSHMLRHSHISLLAELGVPIKAIMERVGHADEKTTIQIYTHVTDTMRDEVSQKMEEISF
ncbi:site-specific integrase [Pseudolactococcus yaeyamensis]